MPPRSCHLAARALLATVLLVAVACTAPPGGGGEAPDPADDDPGRDSGEVADAGDPGRGSGEVADAGGTGGPDDDPEGTERDLDGARGGDDAAEEPAGGSTASGPPQLAVPALHPEVDGWDASRVTIATDAGPVHVDARVAEAPDQRRRGLMHVPHVPDGAGMLFLFEAERTGGFWMKDTLVPLDIAFVGGDGQVRAILTMPPCEADPCPTYDPEVAYLAALEVPAGWYAGAGVAVGDRVTWTDPVPAGTDALP